MPQTIGFIGLGRMGTGMAGNLLAAGFPLLVYNRSAEKAQALVARGAVAVRSPEEVGSRGGVVISIVADDAALQAVATDALAEALGPGGIHVSMSTVLPQTTATLAEHHSRFGAALVAAPVFGRPEAAAAAKLWICASGPAAARDRVKPLFKALCQGVFEFGDQPGAANVVKLAGNFLLTAAIEAMAEASAFAEKNGVSRADLLGMLTGTLFNCPIYTNYSKRIIDADFEKAGFTARLASKDMTLARRTAAASGTPMPILSLLCDRYETALAGGRGDFDATAIARGVAEEAGLHW